MKKPPLPKLRARLHGAFFRALSLLGPGLQRRALEVVFQHRHKDADHWGISQDPYEREKAERILRLLAGRRYRHALEVGCSEGSFTERLAASGCAEQILAIDISARALLRAADRCRRLPSVSLRRMDALSEDPGRGFDLILCAEILYYLGGDARLRALRDRLSAALQVGGELILVHPWPQARGYHQLFCEDATLRLIEEQVVEQAERPYALARLRKIGSSG